MCQMFPSVPPWPGSALEQPLGLVKAIGELRSYAIAHEQVHRPGADAASIPENAWTELVTSVMAERMRRARAGDPSEA